MLFPPLSPRPLGLIPSKSPITLPVVPAAAYPYSQKDGHTSGHPSLSLAAATTYTDRQHRRPRPTRPVAGAYGSSPWPAGEPTDKEVTMHDYTPTDANLGQTERLVSLVGGGLALLAALRRPSIGALPLAMGGGYLLYRGLVRNDPLYEALNIRRSADGSDLLVRQSVTINRSRPDVYTFWRNFENLPRFMQHLQTVRVLDEAGRRSHWVTSAPLGRTVEWEAEITEERPNEWLAWRSLPGADVENEGHAWFGDALDGSGTVVDVELAYRPPLGAPSIVVARLFGEQPWQQVRDDLRRFKQIMEAAETPTLFGQPSGRLKEVEEQRAALRGEQRAAQAIGALPPA